ncbi:MAG: hypothetical protein QY316_07675 [Thermodesulfobacteriota bacterium]|nr:MAG: hypothetical protein QY316_07675 [Thermodesulfobacteriota bacterium]
MLPSPQFRQGHIDCQRGILEAFLTFQGLEKEEKSEGGMALKVAEKPKITSRLLKKVEMQGVAKNEE